MLAMFVDDNGLGQGEVMFAYEQFQGLPSEERSTGEIDFELFCKLLQVEATGEYHHLFTLFDEDNGGTVNIKELILGLCNFITIDKEVRCRFIFEMFDEDRSGFLSEKELIDILKANHMQSEAAVSRKAKTIMKQADRDGSGELNFDEFLIVSQKFPNILFPAISKDQAEAAGPPPPAM